jgi:glutamine---fructose-6-phosphate transaminase (isomerizing)
MINEILQIPKVAKHCFETNRHLSLPINCHYLGMGSSWYAPLALKYCGIPIMPEMSSEYFQYLKTHGKEKVAVLISQSGKSSETLWCADSFEYVIVITNDTRSALALHPHTKQVIDLAAGEEKYSSTKTYINSLIALYLGLGFNPLSIIEKIETDITEFEKKGREWAEMTFKLIDKGKWKGTYIIGNGPNLATAMQAALILTESSGFPFQAMSLAQFDHGPKESSPGSLIYIISPESGKTSRMKVLVKQLESCGAVVSILYISGDEFLTPIPAVIPFFFYAHYLSEKLGRKYPFIIGGKVTEVH